MKLSSSERLWLIILLVNLLVCNITLCQDSIKTPQINVHMDQVRISIGDVLTMKINILATGEQRIVFPDQELDLAPFTILERQRDVETTDEGNIKETLTLNLSIYETGEFEIPPAIVRWENGNGQTGELVTEAQFVQVQSVLNTEEIKPRSFKGYYEIEPRMKYIIGSIAIGLGALLLLIGLIYLVRKLRKRRNVIDGETAITVYRPAHEIALERLEELKKAGYLGSGEIKAYFIDLSDILKEYIGNRYAFQAVEHTTGEIRYDLRNLSVESRSQTEILSVLELSDMVKFAKHLPDDLECRDAMERVESVIENTRETSKPVSDVMNSGLGSEMDGDK